MRERLLVIKVHVTIIIVEALVLDRSVDDPISQHYSKCQDNFHRVAELNQNRDPQKNQDTIVREILGTKTENIAKNNLLRD